MKRLLVLMVMVFMLMCGTAFAESIVLGWDANTDDIDGYNVYKTHVSGSYEFGVSSPNLMVSIECQENDPTCCEYASPQLLWSTTYYWVVTAFIGPANDPVAESGSSNEASHATPEEPLPDSPNDPTGCYIKSIVP